MPWLRWDTSILFDEFCDSLSSDEFRAWSYVMLFVKATGARGNAPYQGHKQMAKIARVPQETLESMFTKAGDRFTFDKGRIYVKHWHRYQEDFRDKSTSPEKTGDTIKTNNGLTPHHTTTTPQDKKLLAVGKQNALADVDNSEPNVDNSDLTADLTKPRPVSSTTKHLCSQDFALRLHNGEFALWKTSVEQMIARENQDRPRNPFEWKPTTGSLDSDLKSLIYKLSDEVKLKILYEALNVLGEHFNWPAYVALCIKYTIRRSERFPVRQPYRFVTMILHRPSEIVSAKSDGLLSGAITQKHPMSQIGGI